MERFWSKVDVAGPEECWPWKACTDTRGYGQFKLNGRQEGAHRVAFRLRKGEIPDGHDVDHLCRNIGCCNPKHLEAVTHKTNCLRGVSFSARNAAKTHCKRGHELAGGNLNIRKDGSRECRACKKIRDAKRRGLTHLEAVRKNGLMLNRA